MNNKELLTKIKKELKNEPISEELIAKSKKEFYNYHKDINTCVICMEEMGELTQALSNFSLGFIKENDLNILEEIVDVKICLDEIIYAFKISEYIIKDKKDKNLVALENNFDINLVTVKAMAEFTQTLSKFLREKIGKHDDLLLNKLAYVDNCLEKLIDIYNIDTKVLQAIKNVKIKRNLERFKNA